MKGIKALIVMGVLVALNACTSTQISSEDVYMTIELDVKPEQVAAFLEVMAEAAPDTRAFPGNKFFDIYVDQDNPGHVLFYEIWESREAQQAYSVFRAQTGFLNLIGPYLNGPSMANFYDKFEESL